MNHPFYYGHRGERPPPLPLAPLNYHIHSHNQKPFMMSMTPSPTLKSMPAISLFSPRPSNSQNNIKVAGSISNGNMNNKRRMIPIPIQVNNAAQKNIERHNRSNSKRNASGTMLAKTNGLELKNGGTKSSNSGTLDELIGSVCQNNGCKVVCTDASLVNTECSFHPGLLTADQKLDTNGKIESPQKQYWACCARKQTNLLGCRNGKHHWVKRNRHDSVRVDWFYRAGLIHLSIFCPSAVPQGTRAESDGLKLHVTIAYGFGTLEAVKDFDLFADIVPAQSVMLISEKKVELILWQLKREQWPRLTVESGDGALCAEDDGDAVFILDDDDENGNGN